MTKALSRVTVEIQLEDDDLGSRADDEYVDVLEAAIQERLAAAPRVGEFDGHEFGGGWAVIYCYGRDVVELAEVVLDAVLPIRGSRQLCMIGSFGGAPVTHTVLLSRSRRELEVAH